MYLYRNDEVWRCNLEQITKDPAEVDAERMPSYYTTGECNLFVRISQFTQLTPDWPSQHLVMANKPDPAEVNGALSNRTTPVFVYELFSPIDVGQQLPEEGGELAIEWLVERTGWTQERLEWIIASLQDESPQVILQGPPGTGKTWVAHLLARYLTNDKPLAYDVVQFHPSYG